MKHSIRRIAQLVGFGIFIMLGAAFFFSMQGCMESVPTNPNQSQIDSARGHLDSVNAGKAVKLHAWQVCAAGPRPERTCPNCTQYDFEWSADLILHRDSMAYIYMDSLQCQPLGLFEDTTTLKLDAFGTNIHSDSVWLQMDGRDSVRYWMAWRPVKLHPDSLRIVSDSVDRVNARSLRKETTW